LIETERLLIRPLADDEREAMLALWRDPANRRVTSPDEARVRRWLTVVWGVWERESGDLVGDCSLHFDTGFGEWELSYGFRRDRWSRGYATEAARACVRHGFEEIGLEKIVADVDPANAASARVLEKCGLEQVSRLDDGRLFYVVTRSSARPRAAPDA
jgi:ribosomal-protein-alanine N-acetyltransferase